MNKFNEFDKVMLVARDVEAPPYVTMHEGEIGSVEDWSLGKKDTISYWVSFLVGHQEINGYEIATFETRLIEEKYLMMYEKYQKNYTVYDALLSLEKYSNVKMKHSTKSSQRKEKFWYYAPVDGISPLTVEGLMGLRDELEKSIEEEDYETCKIIRKEYLFYKEIVPKEVLFEFERRLKRKWKD